MKVKWLGHASFIITSDEGTKVITDPYTVGGDINYGDIKEAADIVTVSHDHPDHNNASAVQSNPQVVTGSGIKEVKGIQFKGIPTYHDESGGKQRGPNTILCFTINEVRICHLADLGHQLSKEQIAEIGEVDILLIPVGGYYTIDAAGASQVCDSLKPQVAIPMHYKTAKCDYPISGVDDFLKGKPSVKKMDASEAEFKKGQLPLTTEIVVLKHAL